MMAGHRGSRMATWVDLDRLSPSSSGIWPRPRSVPRGPDYDDTEAMAEELAAMVMAGPSPDHRLVPAAPRPTDLPI